MPWVEGAGYEVAADDATIAAAPVLEDDVVGERLDWELVDEGPCGMGIAGADGTTLLLEIPGDSDDENGMDACGICNGSNDGVDKVDTGALLLVLALEDDKRTDDAVCELCDAVTARLRAGVSPPPTAPIDVELLVDALVVALDTVVSRVDALLEPSCVFEGTGRLTGVESRVVAVVVSPPITMVVALLVRLTLLQRSSRGASGEPTQCHGGTSTSMPANRGERKQQRRGSNKHT